MLGFAPASPADWQRTTENFFAMAKAAGKTKLIIDISSNGGGYILLGYDLYRQLFPDSNSILPFLTMLVTDILLLLVVQSDYNRIRENDAFLAMSKSISRAFPEDFNPYTSVCG